MIRLNSTRDFSGHGLPRLAQSVAFALLLTAAAQAAQPFSSGPAQAAPQSPQSPHSTKSRNSAAGAPPAKSAAPAAKASPSLVTFDSTHAPASSNLAASNAGIRPPASNYKFPDGLTFFYDVDWRLLKAGTATMRLEGSGQQQRIVATADSVGVVALLYKVHDRFESSFDPKTFCSLSIIKHVEEGFRRVETNIRFDYPRNKSVLDEKNLRNGESKQVEYDIPTCVTGVMGASYYLSAQSLLPDATYLFAMNDGGKTVQVIAHVEARELIKTPAGDFRAVRIQPEAMNGAVKDKGKIWIWYSDDGAHLPVQIRARLAWGTLTLRLQHIERH